MALIFLSYNWITSSVFMEGWYQKCSPKSKCSCVKGKDRVVVEKMIVKSRDGYRRLVGLMLVGLMYLIGVFTISRGNVGFIKVFLQI